MLKRPPVRIRHILWADQEALAQIDAAGGIEPHWPAEAWAGRMGAQLRAGCFVADLAGRAVGYAAFAVGARAIELERIAVVPCWRRRRIGWELVEAVACRLDLRAAWVLCAAVPVGAVPLQRFLHACGLRAYAETCAEPRQLRFRRLHPQHARAE